jgi:hypothetical protein
MSMLLTSLLIFNITRGMGLIFIIMLRLGIILLMSFSMGKGLEVSKVHELILQNPEDRIYDGKKMADSTKK